LFEKSVSSGHRWQKAFTYGSDNSLSVNWNANDGLNVNNINRDADNNIGALRRKSPFSTL